MCYFYSPLRVPRAREKWYCLTHSQIPRSDATQPSYSVSLNKGDADPQVQGNLLLCTGVHASTAALAPAKLGEGLRTRCCICQSGLYLLVMKPDTIDKQDGAIPTTWEIPKPVFYTGHARLSCEQFGTLFPSSLFSMYT